MSLSRKVPGGTIYIAAEFDLEYPDTSNSIPRKMFFPDEVLMELHENSIYGHEQLMLGDRYRDQLEKAADGIKYKPWWQRKQCSVYSVFGVQLVFGVLCSAVLLCSVFGAMKCKK